MYATYNFFNVGSSIGIEPLALGLLINREVRIYFCIKLLIVPSTLNPFRLVRTSTQRDILSFYLFYFGQVVGTLRFGAWKIAPLRNNSYSFERYIHKLERERENVADFFLKRAREADIVSTFPGGTRLFALDFISLSLFHFSRPSRAVEPSQ